MVSAAKEFGREPPRRPLTSLEAIWEDFQWRYKDRARTDQVIEYCRSAKKYPQAVRRAVEARGPDGKHHNHQSKVDITARRKLGASLCSPSTKKLVKQIAKQEENDQLTPWLMSRFDQLHSLVDDIKPYGIGPVTVYDVAVRIGAFLGIEPQSVYLHAGVRQGIKALSNAMERLTFDGEDPTAIRSMREWLRNKAVPMHAFPEPWNTLKADDVEDMLCTYREVFDQWGVE